MTCYIAHPAGQTSVLSSAGQVFAPKCKHLLPATAYEEPVPLETAAQEIPRAHRGVLLFISQPGMPGKTVPS